MHRDDVTLLQIAEACQLIILFRQDVTEQTLESDRKTQSAILHQIMVIGEAVKRLSTELRRQNPTIPWSAIAGMRDRLIHAYDLVDLEEVWNVASDDIPDLLAKIEPLLPVKPDDE